MRMRVFRSVVACLRQRAFGLGQADARRGHWVAASAAFLALSPAIAQETVSYTYDARGRLITVAHSGTVNAGVTANYTYDKADNRCSVIVTTSGPGQTGTCGAGGTGSTCTGVSFTIASNGAVTEGVSSVFTVTKTGTTSSSCTVNYATANGTAVAPGDYTAASGTLTFTSAQTSKTVSVATINNTAVESTENFSMALSAPGSGATLGAPSTATATINDNDSSGGAVSFSIADTYADEGTAMVFTVTKTGSTSSNSSLTYTTANGTALAGSDYVLTSGTLTFAPTDSSKTISVPTYQDTRQESDETFTMNLSAATGGTISDAQGVGTIGDDDFGICPMSATGSATPGKTVSSSGSATPSSKKGVLQPMMPVCP